MFEGKFEFLGENTEKYKTFSVLAKNEIIKKQYKYLLIAQDLWQPHFQILSIISQNKFKNLNVKIVFIFLNMKPHQG